MRKLLSILFLFSIVIYAQQRDTVLINPLPALADTTTAIDSARTDTTAAKKYDVDDIIYASGSDSLIFKIDKKQMEIYGQGELKYKKSDLKSANITIDFNINRIYASGVVDSSDSLKGTPVLSEGGETYEGTKITYDFKTQRGFISLAKNKSEGTAYYGQKVKKVDKNTYFIEDGIYTTCTADTPHYYFYATEMKVILRQQIIAKWIWLHIGGVPLPIPLPFGAFPNESGRRSGFIAPAYGQRAGYGHYFSHFGYFWAINDYFDANALIDFYTKGGYNLNSRFRYSQRYTFTGSLDLTFSDLHQGERTDPDYGQQKNWRIAFYHNQQITPTTRLDANLNFISSKNLINNTSTDYADLLNQNIESNATFFKSWDESGNSLSLNYRRSQELQSGNIHEVLPSLTFSMSQKYPFKRKGRIDPKDQRWYELVGVNYSGNILNNRDKVGGNLRIRGGIQHSASVNASPKLGYFNISPRLSYTERWYNKYIKRKQVFVPDSAGISGKYVLIDEDIKKISMVRDFSFGLTASTRLFGVLQPDILGVEAFRHTVTPSISYTYQPDFSQEKWGYYDYYIDTSGARVKYSKYQKEVFGGPNDHEVQGISFSVGNVFEIKTKKDPTDTSSESKKIQLLKLDAALGYNFALPVNKLSNLSLSYSTQIGEFLNFYGNSTYTFYDFINGKQTNDFLYKKGKGLFRLTNFNFSLSTSISGEKLKGKEQNTQPQQQEVDPTGVFSRTNYTNVYRDEPPDFSIPWDLSLSYTFNLNKDNFLVSRPSSNLQASANINLTESWKLSLMGSYDLIQKQLLAPQIKIFKDLHCWEMNISWNPIGVYRGYRFEIRIKASQLQDLKVTRARGQYSGRY